MRNVMDVPTAGIVTKVGTNVPIMLPIVLNAPNVPTFSTVLQTVYGIFCQRRSYCSK